MCCEGKVRRISGILVGWTEEGIIIVVPFYLFIVIQVVCRGRG